MKSPFATSDLATGYATFRPPLHGRILERVRDRVGWKKTFPRALDVGCGAGLSTNALAEVAEWVIGLEPVPVMLHSATRAQNLSFVAAIAEQIPIRHHCIDLITAAGSLNYVDCELFFQEAARVLRPNGLLVVYDFEPGRSFSDSDVLDGWFSSFIERYPFPRYQARELSPEILNQLATGFRPRGKEHFKIGIPLTSAFYREYMMTETNVAFAIQNGVAREEISIWCSETLLPLWDQHEREVLFRGYFACMSRR
jgi:ubiquinone/menaquinone biosynthesis C-methylase UbiE